MRSAAAADAPQVECVDTLRWSVWTRSAGARVPLLEQAAFSSAGIFGFISTHRAIWVPPRNLSYVPCACTRARTCTPALRMSSQALTAPSGVCVYVLIRWRPLVFMLFGSLHMAEAGGSHR